MTTRESSGLDEKLSGMREKAEMKIREKKIIELRRGMEELSFLVDTEMPKQIEAICGKSCVKYDRSETTE